MEACIDTFSAVFGSGAGDYKSSTRNMSPFNHNFDNAYQSYPHHHQQFSVANQSLAGGDTLNGHYHSLQQPVHIQRQANGSQSGNTTIGIHDVFSPNTNGFEQAMSWTDKPLMSSSTSGSGTTLIGSTNNNHGGNVGREAKMQRQLAPATSSSIGGMSSVTTAVENHSFHPFVGNDGISAAFNLQQLHQGICSVGKLPSWQQDFTFSDCPGASVPSQNDEGDDTRTLPMPLSMSSVPTSAASKPTVLAPEHQLHHSDNRQFANLVLTAPPCSVASNNEPHNAIDRQPLDSRSNGQFSSDSHYANSSVTLTYLTSALNDVLRSNGGSEGVGAVHRSPQQSPLPSYGNVATSSAPSGTNESTADYVKMATTPSRVVRLRTNTRMDMDRLKAQEEDKREKEMQKHQRAVRESKAVPVALPPVVNVVVPSQVLQVTSVLENPTPFHVEQTRKFNIKQYCAGITNSLPDVQGASSSLEGAPARIAPQRPPAKHNRLQHLITDGAVSSAPPNYSTTPAPVSPISVADPGAAASPGPSQRSSVATSVNDEFEDSILDLLLDEKSGDQVASLPQSGLNRVSGVPEASSSCPADSTKDVLCVEDPVRLTKDRIKKDNHNKIERKRRFHINDMITEQGRLLPRVNERHHERIGEVKQNKGSILKASVDYTKVLKQDNEQMHARLQKSEEEKKQLLLRLKRIEQICKQSGVQIPEDMLTWKTATNASDDLTNLLTTEVKIKQEPMTYAGEDFERNICDMMDEDRSIVTGSSDPMFGQPVETEDAFPHPEGMDFND